MLFYITGEKNVLRTDGGGGGGQFPPSRALGPHKRSLFSREFCHFTHETVIHRSSDTSEIYIIFNASAITIPITFSDFAIRFTSIIIT